MCEGGAVYVLFFFFFYQDIQCCNTIFDIDRALLNITICKVTRYIPFRAFWVQSVTSQKVNDEVYVYILSRCEQFLNISTFFQCTPVIWFRELHTIKVPFFFKFGHIKNMDSHDLSCLKTWICQRDTFCVIL